MEHHHSLSSKPPILEQLGRGIIIEPFDPKQLKGCSYDVRIGRWFFRRRGVEGGRTIFNPYDAQCVREHFNGPLEAVPASTLESFCSNPEDWKGISPEDLVILIEPGELILGHTLEFIGGTLDPDSGRCFTAEMKARSSIGRIGFEICRCAGWGDPGYINRWTMEIKNDDPLPALIVAGTRVAQIKFYEVDPVDPEDLYGYDPTRDHYQAQTDLAAIMAEWRPEQLLPKLTKT